MSTHRHFPHEAKGNDRLSRYGSKKRKSKANAGQRIAVKIFPKKYDLVEQKKRSVRSKACKNTHKPPKPSKIPAKNSLTDMENVCEASTVIPEEISRKPLKTIGRNVGKSKGKTENK